MLGGALALQWRESGSGRGLEIGCGRGFFALGDSYGEDGRNRSRDPDPGPHVGPEKWANRGIRGLANSNCRSCRVD